MSSKLGCLQLPGNSARLLRETANQMGLINWQYTILEILMAIIPVTWRELARYRGVNIFFTQKIRNTTFELQCPILEHLLFHK